MNAAHKDKNMYVSGKRQLEETMREFQRMFENKMQVESKLSDVLLADIFDDYEEKDIREIAKDK